MQATPLEQTLRSLIEPSMESMGYALVLVRLKEGGKRQVLEVVAERADGAGMGIDDCTEISHMVSALMDVKDPIPSAYHLEVSSPGLDRPLVRPEDYVRFAGFEVKLETALPVEGRKRFRGMLQGMQESNVVIAVEGVEHALAFSNIRSGKLVLNDALLAPYMKKQKNTK